MKLALLVLAVLAPLCVRSQGADPAYSDLLLDNPVTIAGRVVTAQGEPIPGVRIDYVGGNANWYNNPNITSADGYFTVTTRSPAIVFRRPGYQSHRLFTQNAGDSLIVMTRSSHPKPVCTAQAKCASSPGQVCVPQPPRTKFRYGHDIDYFEIWLAPRGLPKGQGITYGQGGLWGAGIPADRDVWVSETFNEDVFPMPEVWAADSRGRKKSGRYWRQIGIPMESAFYNDVDQKTAAVLDNILDGTCFGPARRQ
jgi:hypothetical protein